MAASATPPNADSPRVAVATSGGRDSTALLHATARAAQAQGLRVVALHVHHGLQAVADAWVGHLQTQCREWALQGLPVELRWCRLDGRPARGESVEAWARNGRYAALARMAGEAGAHIVLLAHHRRDQAETFMLQALRGGGAAGLAAMPREAWRAGICWVRPWLQLSREAIDAYVDAHGLAFVDDPSNEDHGFARNRLRHQVMPALSAAFPEAEQALAAAARQAQQARECLAVLADMDLQRAAQGDELRLGVVTALSPARQVNLLRHWLWQRCGRGASETLLQRMVRELPGEPPASWPAGGHVLHRYRGLLRCEAVGQGTATAVEASPAAVSLTAPGRHRIEGWSGWLDITPVSERGVSPQRLQNCQARPRRGGEQFQLKLGSIPRSLKKQYQAEGVPAWLRGGPLLWQGDDLLFVPGLGLDARHWAPSGEVQWALEWVADGAG